MSSLIALCHTRCIWPGSIYPRWLHCIKRVLVRLTYPRWFHCVICNAYWSVLCVTSSVAFDQMQCVLAGLYIYSSVALYQRVLAGLYISSSVTLYQTRTDRALYPRRLHCIKCNVYWPGSIYPCRLCCIKRNAYWPGSIYPRLLHGIKRVLAGLYISSSVALYQTQCVLIGIYNPRR
ncbi:5553_t:CDS:1, partial [Ambispora gerdemannii]